MNGYGLRNMKKNTTAVLILPIIHIPKITIDGLQKPSPNGRFILCVASIWDTVMECCWNINGLVMEYYCTLC